MVPQSVIHEVSSDSSEETKEVDTIKSDDEYLKELRDALGDFYETMLIPKDDKMLLRFLRFTDYDIERSVERIHETNALVIKYQDLKDVPYEQIFTPTLWKYIEEYKGIILFKEKDQLGRSVVLLKGKYWDPDEVDIDTLFHAGYFGLDILLDSEEVQRNGLVVILDCSGIGHMKAAYILTKITMRHVMQLVELYHGAITLRFGAVFTVNTPFAGAAMYNAFKYLVKRKLRDRIHVNFCGPKYLQKHFPKDFLPQSLLGNIPDDDCADYEIFEKLRLKHAKA